jgi:hypothetical protein
MHSTSSLQSGIISELLSGDDRFCGLFRQTAQMF